MESLQGKKNRYTCQDCGHQYVTVDRDDGTTPFMAGCQKPGCKGMAQSEFYRVDQSLPATHEWYRAGDVEARGMKPHIRQHHDMGGLFLRKASVTMTLRPDIEAVLAMKEALAEKGDIYGSGPVVQKRLQEAISALEKHPGEMRSRMKPILSKYQTAAPITRDLWQDLMEKGDRNSPAEYPDMCLITFEEFAGYLEAAVAAAKA